mgnify:CR=1 FL=1
MYIDLYDTSVVGCSNKTDRDSNSGYKKSVNLANADLHFLLAEREALEPTYSRNIIKLQIINNQALFGVHSKSKSF